MKNLFKGLKSCLKLYSGYIEEINNAYNEVKNDKTKRELFYSLLFYFGDVTNRQHNIFKNEKVDNGGASKREDFFTIMNWIKDNDYNQFLKFLNAGLFNEYTCFDNLFRNRVRTSGYKTIIKNYSMLSDKQYRKDLAKYIATIINGKNLFNKILVAKFLSLPRLSPRKNHSKMLAVTKTNMLNKCEFLAELSDILGWKYSYNGKTYARFDDYVRWRKQYNKNLESVLFSTGRINDFDKEEFLHWLDSLPAIARSRVEKRLYKNKKFLKFNIYYKEWLKFKEEAQQKQRELEETIRQGENTEENLKELEKIKKQAKVTTGATNFVSLYDDILNNKIDKLRLESFINKVNIPYNNLIILDVSGSMHGAPFNFAKFLASVLLVKNPDDNGRSIIGTFERVAKLYSSINRTITFNQNLFYARKIKTIAEKPFVDPSLSFYDNYQNISNFLEAVFGGGGTDISSIPECFNDIIKDDPNLLDFIKNYPIWTIVSDGEFNNMETPQKSLKEFFKKCENYFGYRPYIIAIDVNNRSSTDISKFADINNFLYINNNPEMIEQVLTNFKNSDDFDVYTILDTIYKSNRYVPVRSCVL